MIKDKLLELASAQAVTVSAASTNVIDQGAANPADADLFLVCVCKEAATAAGAATVNFKIESSVDEAFTSPISHFQSGAIGKAAITLNKEMFKVELPPGTKRYIRAYFEIATGPLTAGKFDVFAANAVYAH